MAQTHSANSLYQSVINDVITSVRESFLDESMDEIEVSKAVEQPSMGNDAAALDAKMNMTRGRYLGGVPAQGGSAGDKNTIGGDQ